MGLDFEVTPEVLVPNPDTEVLVQRAVAIARESEGGFRVADVGTGSGCIAIAIAHYAPNASVWATDVSGEALSVAARNVAKHGLGARVHLERGDLMQPLAGEFNLVCANLPYVAAGTTLPAEVTAQPAGALYADSGDPLRSWVDAARDPSGGLHIIYPRVVGVPDTGILYTPMVFGPNIFVTSSSGYIYSIYRDPIRGAGNQIAYDSGEVAWGFRDDTLQHDTTHKTYFRAGPHIFDNLNLVIAAGNYNNGTTDPSDDLGIVYVFNAAGGGLSWKRTFSSRLLATPVAWWDPFNTHQGTWFGTSTGEVYAFSTSGQYVAPLAPSWAHSYLDPSNHLRQGYPSGNMYILGTDARR